MPQQDTPLSATATSSSNADEARGHIGLAIPSGTAYEAVESIVAAEAAGVRQVWMTQAGLAPDTLMIFAAAAMRTERVRMGTAVVPTYPRHPLALALQALALDDLAPGRLRLGIGPSHRVSVEGVYGLQMGTPLEHEREYVAILRAALWDGPVDFRGQYFSVQGTMPRTPHTPILISALRTGAFHLAGEIADGAISWMCPVSYLIEQALPALREGAAARQREAPPLVAHVPVALTTDRSAALTAARKQLGRYAALPFYARMFAAAGFPPAADGTMPDALIEHLVVSGDAAAVSARLRELLAQGLDELLVMLVPVTDDASAELRQLAAVVGSA